MKNLFQSNGAGGVAGAVGSGTTADVMASPEMRHAYLGDLEVPA